MQVFSCPRWCSFVLAASMQLGCGGRLTSEGSPPPLPTRPDTESDADVDASPSPPVLLEDSHTLRVTISIFADGSEDLSLAGPEPAPGDVSVTLYVDVADADSGAPIDDAHVTGGHIGEAIALHLHEPGLYDDEHFYTGTVTGYERDWEFSVVRGADVLTGVVLTGPSYPTIDFATAADSATLRWSPALEANVVTGACATQTTGLLATTVGLRWCRPGYDEGIAVLTASNEDSGDPASPFPEKGARYVPTLVEQIGGVPIGSRGGVGSVSITVRAGAAVAP